MDKIEFGYLFTSIDGRINRQRWWIGVGILILAWAISSALFGQDGFIAFVIAVLISLAGICLHVKRCHDRDQSGWWCLLLLIPAIGFLWAVINLGILEGTSGSNRFGPDPLAGGA
jgi:uncharacterized membrane protein YhaH (DUF805 family)